MTFPTRQDFFRLAAALALLCATLGGLFGVGARGRDQRATENIARSGADEPSAGDAAKPLPFEPGEDLIYQADFSKLVLRGVEIAEFRFTASRAKVSATNAGESQPRPPTQQSDATQPRGAAAQSQVAPPNLVFKGDVRAKGFFHKLFGIDFHYTQESVVDARDFLILRTTKRDEQGRRVRESVAEFDRRADRFTFTERDPNAPAEPPRVVNAPVRDAAHDIVSAIYYLRAQPLAVGKTFDLAVSDDGRTAHVPVRVVERQVMSTAVGRVAAFRLDVGLFGAGRLVEGRGGEMTIWLTDDARRLPVRARLDADIGTLDIKLKRVTGGIARQK
ncbi:MAG: DUF3108 domain-containing protein [Pyrinomonadaceae bacterium]